MPDISGKYVFNLTHFYIYLYYNKAMPQIAITYPAVRLIIHHFRIVRNSLTYGKENCSSLEKVKVFPESACGGEGGGMSAVYMCVCV